MFSCSWNIASHPKGGTLMSTSNELPYRQSLNNNIRETNNTTANKDIHNGESTHHQLQSMYPVSLSVMKTMVRRPENPMPLLELFCILFPFTSIYLFAPHLAHIQTLIGPRVAFVIQIQVWLHFI